RGDNLALPLSMSLELVEIGKHVLRAAVDLDAVRDHGPPLGPSDTVMLIFPCQPRPRQARRVRLTTHPVTVIPRSINRCLNSRETSWPVRRGVRNLRSRPAAARERQHEPRDPVSHAMR